MGELNQSNEEFQFGDIVIAKRYNNSHDKLKINLGHRVGPFIVLDKVDDKYMCIYGTTKNIYNKDHEVLEVNTTLRKTFFVVEFIRDVSREDIGEKIGTLDERKKEILKLKLKRETLINKTLSVGDIISLKNELYFVKTINPIMLIKVNKNIIAKNNLFSVMNNNYSFDFNFISIYGNITDFEIVDYLDTEQIDYINKCMYLYNNKSFKNKNINRGMLIEYVGRIYYVYGTDKDNALMYEVVENCQDIDAEKTIVINGKKYEGLFKTGYEVNVNSLYILKDIATEEEIENNRIVKKAYLKKYPDNKKMTYSDYIEPSTIVCDRSAARVKYLVLSKEDNKLILIALEEIMNENYKAITIRNVKSVNLCDRYDEDSFNFILAEVCKYNDWLLSKKDRKELEKKLKKKY